MSTLTHTPATRPVVGYNPLLTTEETLDAVLKHLRGEKD